MRQVATALLLVVAAARPFAAGRQVQPGTISGTVVSTDAEPQPITRAIVTLTGGNITDNISAITDPSGRFRFQNLAPGRYSVSVTKAAYLPTWYGATRPGRPGTSIALAASQQLDLKIALPRGAVITGTVRDEFGQPASGIQVTVSQAALVAGTSGFRPSADVVITDDRGAYRAFALMPDEYVVSAVPRTTGSGEITAPTRAEFDARVRGLEQRHGAASPGVVSPPQVQSSESQRSVDEPARLGFAPTFHPGTTIAGNAARIRVGAGDERAGVDIALVPVRAARVSGTIQSNEIPPQRLRPSLTVMGPPQPTTFSPTLIGPNASGSFTFANVTPGRYTLLVRGGQGALMTYADGRNGATTDNPGIAPTFAAIDLDVDGNDISGLTLTLRPAFSMSGRVEFQGTMKPQNSVRISMPAAAGSASAMESGLIGAGSTLAATTRPDGTFQIGGIIPGVYSVTANAATGWRLRSVMVNGRDVLDEPLQIDGGSTDITDAVVTLVDVRSELAGTLTTASGQPAREFTVLVFPLERSFWRPGARRIKTARPASDGAFSIMDLPAGEYLLAALTDVDPSDLQQTSFLEQIVGAAVRITIADGQKTRQDLRIAR